MRFLEIGKDTKFNIRRIAQHMGISHQIVDVYCETNLAQAYYSVPASSIAGGREMVLGGLASDRHLRMY